MESSKLFLLVPDRSLDALKSAGFAAVADGAAVVIRSEVIWCCCWNGCMRACCVCCVRESVCAGRREPRSWCLGGV